MIIVFILNLFLIDSLLIFIFHLPHSNLLLYNLIIVITNYYNLLLNHYHFLLPPRTFNILSTSIMIPILCYLILISLLSFLYDIINLLNYNQFHLDSLQLAISLLHLTNPLPNVLHYVMIIKFIFIINYLIILFLLLVYHQEFLYLHPLPILSLSFIQHFIIYHLFIIQYFNHYYLDLSQVNHLLFHLLLPIPNQILIFKFIQTISYQIYLY
jgi:hypothetical protein